MADNKPTCILPDCDNPAWARNMCGTHYSAWRTNGYFHRAPIFPKSLCTVPGCRRPQKSKSLCNSHYNRFLATGETGKAEFAVAKKHVVDGRKQCGTCGEWKPLEGYNKHPHGTGGVGANCRLCLAAKSREWFAKNPEYRTRWNEKHAERKLSNVHERRAIENDAAAEYIDRQSVFRDDGFICQLCDQTMDMSKKTPHPLAPTLDHILPISRGGTHTRENVQSAHFHCNVSKGSRDEPLTVPAA